MRRRLNPGVGPGVVAAVRVVLALTVMPCAPFSSHAANQYTILGAGSRPCGSWLQARSQATPESAALQSWVLGYVTSVNANVLNVAQDVADGTSPDGLFTWIDNYCASHPLDSVARATGSLVDSLRAKNGAR